VVSLPSVPTRVWQDEAVRSALADWDFGQVSRMVRQLVPLRQEDVAALTGLSQSYLSMLECGDRRLTDVSRVVQFLTGLGTPPDLVRLPLPGISPLPDAAAPARTAASGQTAPEPEPVTPTAPDPMLPWTADRMLTALRLAHVADNTADWLPTDANGPVSATAMAEAAGTDTPRPASGIALNSMIQRWDAEQAEPLRRATAGTRVSHELCGHLQGTLDELRVMDKGSGSGAVADLARAHLALVVRVLERSTYDEVTGRRLTAVAADTATQAGWFAFDAGRPDAARAYMLAGLRAAHAAADDRLGAGALSYLAIHGYSSGDPRDAVRAAEAGRRRIARLDAPHLSATLLTRQARGHAAAGEGEAARRALGEASELCARGRGEDDPHWLYWMNEGEIHGQSGSAHLALGNTALAVESFGHAIQADRAGERRTHGLFLSRAAQAHARAGDLDAACATGDEAVSIAETVQSARLREHLRDLSADLRRGGSSRRSGVGARVLTERIAALAS
jgi:transcriptional regulator with XRE-family HTH domain